MTSTTEIAKAIAGQLEARGLLADWLQFGPDGERMDMVLMMNQSHPEPECQRHFAICVFDGANLTDAAPEWLREIHLGTMEYAWSYYYDFDGPHFDSLEELLDNYDIREGDKVYVGEKRPYDGLKAIDADFIAEAIQERISGDLGVCAESWEYDDAAMGELDTFLTAWMKKHNPTGFYLISEDKEYIVTAEDLA
ncbi:MAG: hypothetical protein ACRDC8_10990 [Aeromonas veronii]